MNNFEVAAAAEWVGLLQSPGVMSKHMEIFAHYSLQSRSRFQRNTQQHLGPYATAKQVTGYTDINRDIKIIVPV